MKYIRIILSEPIIVITFIPSVIFLLLMLIVQKKFLIKVGFLHSNRLGHFAANTELYILKKKKFNIKSYDLFYFGRKEISNIYLGKLWKNKLNILPYSLLRCLDLIIRATFLKKKFSCNYFSNTDRDLFELYESYTPTITIDENDKKVFLEKFNLQTNDKIVCINIRDNEYLKTIYDPKIHNLRHHNYRDCKIDNFNKVINFLLKNDYKVFRVGVRKSNYFEIKHQNFFDKKYSDKRDETSDVILSSICSFCISTGSGFDALPRIFRKPILFVNHLPIINYHSFCKNDLTICKHIFSNQKLSIENIFNNSFYDGLETEFYEKNNLKVIENSSDEILNVTKEMILRLEKKFILSEENLKLQNLIKAKIIKFDFEKVKHGKLLSFFGEEYLRNNFYD